MCEQTSHIKLCSCEVQQINPQNAWRLIRGATTHHCVGHIIQIDPTMIPAYQEFDLETYLFFKILEDLNSKDVFDFTYKPEENDRLIISYEDMIFEYYVVNGNFTHLDAFEEFADDGSTIKSGIIKQKS
jgi:hypothetical protein